MAASILGAFLEHPKTIHIKAAKRDLRYVKDTKLLSLNISLGKRSQLFVYTDANWAGELGKGLQNRAGSWFCMEMLQRIQQVNDNSMSP